MSSSTNADQTPINDIIRGISTEFTFALMPVTMIKSRTAAAKATAASESVA